MVRGKESDTKDARSRRHTSAIECCSRSKSETVLSGATDAAAAAVGPLSVPPSALWCLRERGLVKVPLDGGVCLRRFDAQYDTLAQERGVLTHTLGGIRDHPKPRSR